MKCLCLQDTLHRGNSHHPARRACTGSTAGHTAGPSGQDCRREDRHCKRKHLAIAAHPLRRGGGVGTEPSKWLLSWQLAVSINLSPITKISTRPSFAKAYQGGGGQNSPMPTVRECVEAADMDEKVFGWSTRERLWGRGISKGGVDLPHCFCLFVICEIMPGCVCSEGGLYVGSWGVVCHKG